MLSSFRSALFADLVEELRVPESKVARAYAAMTRPIGRASHSAFTRWSHTLCPAVIHRSQQPNLTVTQRQVSPPHTHSPSAQQRPPSAQTAVS